MTDLYVTDDRGAVDPDKWVAAKLLWYDPTLHLVWFLSAREFEPQCLGILTGEEIRIRPVGDVKGVIGGRFGCAVANDDMLSSLTTSEPWSHDVPNPSVEAADLAIEALVARTAVEPDEDTLRSLAVATSFAWEEVETSGVPLCDWFQQHRYRESLERLSVRREAGLSIVREPSLLRAIMDAARRYPLLFVFGGDGWALREVRDQVEAFGTMRDDGAEIKVVDLDLDIWQKILSNRRERYESIRNAGEKEERLIAQLELKTLLCAISFLALNELRRTCDVSTNLREYLGADMRERPLVFAERYFEPNYQFAEASIEVLEHFWHFVSELLVRCGYRGKLVLLLPLSALAETLSSATPTAKYRGPSVLDRATSTAAASQLRTALADFSRAYAAAEGESPRDVEQIKLVIFTSSPEFFLTLDFDLNLARESCLRIPPLSVREVEYAILDYLYAAKNLGAVYAARKEVGTAAATILEWTGGHPRLVQMVLSRARHLVGEQDASASTLRTILDSSCRILQDELSTVSIEHASDDVRELLERTLDRLQPLDDPKDRLLQRYWSGFAGGTVDRNLLPRLAAWLASGWITTRGIPDAPERGFSTFPDLRLDGRAPLAQAAVECMRRNVEVEP